MEPSPSPAAETQKKMRWINPKSYTITEKFKSYTISKIQKISDFGGGVTSKEHKHTSIQITHHSKSQIRQIRVGSDQG